MKEKTCENCSSQFMGRDNQLYCSPRCKSAINNQRVAERDKNARIIEYHIKSNRRILMMLHKLYGDTELPEFMITKTPFKMKYHNGILQDKATVRILDFTLTKLANNNFIIKKPFVTNGDSNLR